VTARVRRRGVAIKEMPITYLGRTRQQGKKIGLGDAWTAFLTLLKYRLVPA
jgi:hypothetical protein